MMEHPDMLELMQRALDDGLDAAAQSRLERHLATCAHCAQEWAGMQAVHRQLLAAPRLSASSVFTARVMERIAAEQRQAPVSAVPTFALAAAAGVLAVLTLAVMLAPLAGLANFEVWAGILSDSLGLVSAAIAWLTLLLTFVSALPQTAGDGLLVVGIAIGLIVTLIWIRLVAGSDLFRRPTYMNGGV